MDITYRGTKLETSENDAVVRLGIHDALHVMCGCNLVYIRHKADGWVIDYNDNGAIENKPIRDGFLDAEAQQRVVENIYGG